MNPYSDTAEPDLLRSAERWAPAQAELWGAWRMWLGADRRAGALLPLQAALSGLVAFRHLENHPLSVPIHEFRPHLHALRVTYAWALELVAQLSERGSHGNASGSASRRLNRPST